MMLIIKQGSTLEVRHEDKDKTTRSWLRSRPEEYEAEANVQGYGQKKFTVETYKCCFWCQQRYNPQAYLMQQRRGL